MATQRPTLAAADRIRALPAAIVLSALGLVAHNALSLPLATLLGVETVLPAAVAGALAMAAARGRGGRGFGALLFAWGALHFVAGGVLSVLPIGLFPFVPEQSPGHYAAHAVYAAGQVPLLVASSRLLKRGDGL